MKRLPVSLAVALAVSPAAYAQNVDTSNWKCEYCPFEEGYRGDYDVGASVSSDDTAYFGNGTGYDEEGAYANVDGAGSYTSDNQRLDWRIEDLGLDSRVVEFEGGKPGRYDYYANWNELPYRRFITTSAVHTDAGNATLDLPSDWVRAGTTSGFTALGSNLFPQAIESDRQTLELGGAYRFTDAIGIRADYRRRGNEGVRIWGAPSFTNASQLAAPIDHVTDEVELGLRYGGNNAFVDLSWYLSDFDNQFEALTWEQPFTTAAGAETSAMAQAPDNQFQQIRLSGGYAFPEWRTTLSASVAAGEIEQTAAFLPYTTNANLVTDTLPRNSLGGSIDTTNVLLSLNSRPFKKARLRASYRYDERDNQTPVELYNRVIADAAVSGDLQENIAYSYERSRFEVVGDYDLIDTVRISGGYERRELDRDFQEVASQNEDIGYGRIRWRPTMSVELDGRIGTARREIDDYNEAIGVAAGQNPLMRKYNMAYRFREFGEFRASWSPVDAPVAFSLTALRADDDYSKSEIGLRSGKEQSYTGDLSWFLADKASVFFTAGYESIESDQLGGNATGPADWAAAYDDSFMTYGFGFMVNEVADKFDFRLNVMTSSGESQITIDPTSGAADQFPDLETDLNRVDFEVTYRRSERVDLMFTARYMQFETADWQLDGVTPNSVPLLLALGAEPYDEDTFIIGFGIRVRSGAN